MKKAVFLVVLAVIVVLAVGFWFLRPEPYVLSAERAEKTARSTCTDYLEEITELLGAVGSDDRQCYKLGTDTMKYYCLSWFGIDLCKNLPEENQASCTAVFNRNLPECRDDYCFAILAGESGCSDPACKALANRDLAALKDPSLCELAISTAVRNTECVNNARTPEQAQACFSAQAE